MPLSPEIGAHVGCHTFVDLTQQLIHSFDVGIEVSKWKLKRRVVTAQHGMLLFCGISRRGLRYEANQLPPFLHMFDQYLLNEL